ncbi:Type II secretory pathway, pullulanase PulA [Rhodobacterales bacterium 59_46_T64]|nr:Type II secretory pathway, pullulanase PulA [Rhodobacterales bacterium 59_46_T64]
MIISRGRRYIFIHIPKTGGTAMALALEARAMKDDVMAGDTPKAVKRRGKLRGARAAGRIWKHSTLADLDGLITPAEVAEFFTFTLVRNPWDRMVSYYHWLQGQHFDHPAVHLAKASSFTGFLNHPQTAANLRASHYASYMCGADGSEHCDAYIRLEHVAQDAARLEAHLGFALRLPQANASVRRADYRSYYSDSDAQTLSEICATDIARFNYSFT